MAILRVLLGGQRALCLGYWTCRLKRKCLSPKKYLVWPLLNFSVAVDDYTTGLTHVLCGKDHFDNTKRQKYIFDYMGWKTPEYIHYGRVQFEGLRLCTTQTKQAIKEGKYEGWADIRLPFIGALRRRGFQPETFRRFVICMEVSLTDKHVDVHEFFKSLEFHNCQIIEPTADRYFFVDSPKEITIKGAPQLAVELDRHPTSRKEGRKFNTPDTFLVQEEAIAPLEEGQIYRLMNVCNFVEEKGGYTFHSKDVESYRKAGGRIMHWLPANADNVDVEIFMDDGSVKIGKGGDTLRNLEPGTLVQFERQCFARFEEKDGLVYKFVLDTHQ